MAPTPSRKNQQVWVVLLNALVNLFWTVLCVAPVFLFCLRHVSQASLDAFLAVSPVPYLIPRSVLKHLLISKQPATYRGLGVLLINQVSQDGKLVRHLAGSRRSTSSQLPEESDLQKMERNSYTRERFHLACMIFFLCVMGSAVHGGLLGWTAFLFVANVIYNVYPVLLQHYLRVRIQAIRARKSGRQEPTASGNN